MGFHTIAGAAFRALTARKDGPSLYDVCDPVLLKYRGGDPHLGKFYRTALGNPALRPLLLLTGPPGTAGGPWVAVRVGIAVAVGAIAVTVCVGADVAVAVGGSP